MDLHEGFKVLLLNRSKKVLCLYNASLGGITGTVADPRLIFTAALKASAVCIILAHNHPSGLLVPSSADEEFTMKFKGAGQQLYIKVIDHLIFTADT